MCVARHVPAAVEAAARAEAPVGRAAVPLVEAWVVVAAWVCRGVQPGGIWAGVARAAAARAAVAAVATAAMVG